MMSVTFSQCLRWIVLGEKVFSTLRMPEVFPYEHFPRGRGLFKVHAAVALPRGVGMSCSLGKYVTPWTPTPGLRTPPLNVGDRRMHPSVKWASSYFLLHRDVVRIKYVSTGEGSGREPDLEWMLKKC